MKNPGVKLKEVTSQFANGNVWMDHCPKEASLEEWIVYSSISFMPTDFGDDTDMEWEEGFSVKWTHKGNVNYYEIRDQLRSALREAGFSLGPITCGYDGEDKRTNVMLVVYMVE